MPTIAIDTTMANPSITTTEKLSLWTPFPTSPILKDPKASCLDPEDEQWQNIKAIIAAIAVPNRSLSSPTNSTRTSENEDEDDDDDNTSASASDQETSTLLLPKVVDSSPPPSTTAYGTFTPSSTSTPPTVIPLDPSTTPLLTSLTLTPVYILLLLLPLLPFWIFTAFLVYVAATTTTSATATLSPGLVLALAALLPFNVVGTVAIVRFAVGERAKVAHAAAERTDVEACGASRRSSRGSVEGEKKQRLWRPSMRFVLHGARREGRREM